jgi:uncharacterized protein with HEPN domain
VSRISRKDRRTLRLMSETLAQAERLTALGRQAFDSDETIRLAAEAIVSRLGEATGRLSDSFTATHPDIPWRKIVSTRNIVAHEYHRIDYEIIWQTISEAMPELASRLSDDLPAASPAPGGPPPAVKRPPPPASEPRCGQPMPRARARCILRRGHAGPHRSR